MATVNRAKVAKLLQEGLYTHFEVGATKRKPEYTKIFTTHKSKKAYEEDQEIFYTGAAAVKGEGAPIGFDSIGQGFTHRYTMTTFGLGLSVTKEVLDDNLYLDLAKKAPMALEKSMNYTKELKGADVLNNAFDSSFTGGDGVSLCNVSHPLMGGGTYSNRLVTPADLSETSLENLLIGIDGLTDAKGIPAQVKGTKLVIPRQLRYQACRILKSTLRTGTADNDINALLEEGVLPGGAIINHFLDDEDAWFICTDANEGLKHFQRQAMEKHFEYDGKTCSSYFVVNERYDFGWSNAQGIAGSAGV